MKIDKNRTYTTRDGRAVRIYATDAGGDYPIHGSTKEGDNWGLDEWDADGYWCAVSPWDENDLIEALKPNGIPVDLPDPPEVEGYTWEARGWGWKTGNPVLSCFYWMKDKEWVGVEGQKYNSTGKTDVFSIEYIPIPAVEMTLAEVCKALGKTVKIVK